MVSREEVLFTEGFISALSVLNIEQIPFANGQFRRGVEHLKRFLESNYHNNEVYGDIRSIFAKRPVSGDYERMKQALESHNGSALSFILNNPKWERANISITRLYAEKILDDSEYQIPREIMIKAAEAFCTGAEIEM